MTEFNVGDKVFWNDPDDGICSGEYWVTGISGDILYLEGENHSGEVEAMSDECTKII